MAGYEDNEQDVEQTLNHFWWIIRSLLTPLNILFVRADMALAFQKTHLVLRWASALHCSTHILEWEYIYYIFDIFYIQFADFFLNNNYWLYFNYKIK